MGEENEGEKKQETQSGEGGRETDRRERGTTERVKESARDCPPMQPTARLVAAASTAPLHIHPRYIDLSRPPPSSRLTALLATLLTGYSRASGTQCGVGAGRCCAGIRDSARLGAGAGGGSAGSGGDDGGGGGGGAELT